MNLRQVELFKAIIETGTVTAAARRLNMSQPAATQMLAGLERSVGFALFARDRRRLVPTNEALTFYAEVRRAFVGLDMLRSFAKETRDLQRGHIVLGVMPALAGRWMPSVVARFLGKHPGVRITLQTQVSSRIVEWVSRQQVDLGVAYWGSDNEGVADEPFAELQCVCLLPPGHQLGAQRLIQPADLQDEQFISVGERESQLINPVLTAAGVSVDDQVVTTFGSTVCGMVAEGLGVTVLDCVSAADHLHRGIVVRPFKPLLKLQIRLFRALGRPQSPIVETFAAHLRQCASDDRLGVPANALYKPAAQSSVVGSAGTMRRRSD